LNGQRIQQGRLLHRLVQHGNALLGQAGLALVVLLLQADHQRDAFHGQGLYCLFQRGVRQGFHQQQHIRLATGCIQRRRVSSRLARLSAQWCGMAQLSR
jgi:hypothetical protein